MMRLKYYATFRGYSDSEKRNKVVAFYVDYMKAVIVKSDSHHSNVRLFGQIDLLMCEGPNDYQTGYHVIKFEDKEREIFNDAVIKMREGIKAGQAKLSYDLHEARWGTSFFEFVDPIGTSWVYEINTKK